ncbi:DUF262 domain-containing protein [Eubacterium sp.]
MLEKELDVFEEYEMEDEEEITIRPYEVDCLPNDYNITTLISLIERGYMKIPSFQRNYVWKKDMASKFIESIIIGLPIPQIFLFERERNNFLVIDGQQRLVTIYLFKKQRFPKNATARATIRKYLSLGKQIPDSELASDDFEDFKLKLASVDSQENQLNKLKYDTLDTIKKYDFKGEFDFNRTIRTITIKQIVPCEDDSSMFEIFSRLNSGGVMLRPQEIRMSIYYSPFYETLVSELNINVTWRKFVGKKEPDLHMGDIEALVRAFAMLEMANQYKSPLKNFLNGFSKRAMKFSKDEIQKCSEMFSAFCESCNSLPEDAFRNDTNKFVISLFEATFVAVCEKLKAEGVNNKKVTTDSFNKLKTDTSFAEASQGSTASAGSVKTRLERARAIIELK